MNLALDAYSLGYNSVNADQLRRVYQDMVSRSQRSQARQQQSQRAEPTSPRMSQAEQEAYIQQTYYPMKPTMNWGLTKHLRPLAAQNQREMFANSDAAAMGKPLPYPDNPYAAETAAAARSGQTQLTDAGRQMMRGGGQRQEDAYMQALMAEIGQGRQGNRQNSTDAINTLMNRQRGNPYLQSMMRQ